LVKFPSVLIIVFINRFGQFLSVLIVFVINLIGQFLLVFGCNLTITAKFLRFLLLFLTSTIKSFWVLIFVLIVVMNSLVVND